MEELEFLDMKFPRETISKAFIIAVGSAVYIVIAVILLSLLESKFDFIALLFETSSAFATVGILSRKWWNFIFMRFV